MSRLDANDPDCHAQSEVIQLLIKPRSKDLGGFSVKRVLPASKKRSIGPFVFFDEMGPANFPPGDGINVRPHPHIGLSTVTFLFEGEILHRDSLGFVQPIQPGAVNLMTAGRGIVHSERTSDALLASGQKLHGIQVWMALPEAQQEIDPAFKHYPADTLPSVHEEKVSTTVIIGSYQDAISPVSVLPETLYLEQRLAPDASVGLPDAEELGIYVVSGSIHIDGCQIDAGTLALISKVLKAPKASKGANAPDQAIETTSETTIETNQSAHIMIIGGEAFSPRRLWWNFVHTSEDRIEQAKRDWQNNSFNLVPGDDEFIPLPEK